jgi:hypothetical protein
MLPRVTPRCLLVGEAIQSAHVSLVELLLVLCLKVVADVSDVEACARALHLQINPIEITKAYGQTLFSGREGVRPQRMLEVVLNDWVIDTNETPY